MQRNTKTVLEFLRIGDRFYKNGDNKKRIMEVHTKQPFKTIVIDPNMIEQYRLKMALLKRNDIAVVFIRHTKPLPGDECFIEDLVEGDIFRKPSFGHLVDEYKLIAPGHDFYDVAPIGDTLLMEKAGRLATVIFVRHKEVKA
jgi:hypothetical protein